MRVHTARLVGLMALTAAAIAANAQDVNPALFNGMQWREIGPFRGGRSVACSGAYSQKDVFYMGTCGGGLWKTEDAGENWTCVSDGYFKTGSVGAIGVSPSNPDIVYVGMGETELRGNVSHGDGVYKSTDGGKTWEHMGLASTQSISRMRVHPSNPDIAWAAVMGHLYGPHPDRGVYKTIDGGKTWRKVLYVSNRAGAVDLSFAPTNPNTIFAATWEGYRTPFSLVSGGPGSKIFKSTDGGERWTEITNRPGLPSGVIGKVGVSVSPANPDRVYAMVESLEGGLFSSNDGGMSWEKVNEDRNYRQRAFYYTRICADPKDADTVYVLNVSMGKSTNGGRTFRTVRTPHSDNHDIWIDPDNADRMINANDGGANVSDDGGANWTEQDYPTAQIYHVTTDNAFPYNLLGAQQDSSTVRIPSRTFGRGITSDDWTSTAGSESGYVAAKPDDPDVVLGGNYGGYLEMFNHRTRLSRNISPWPDNPMGSGADVLVHRMQWTFPIVFSPHNPNVVYTCSQHVMKSTDLGGSWEVISPDLSRNDKSTQGSSGGPITQDNTSVEYYATVFTLAESPLTPGLLWAGSDDGLVHVSRNGGQDWENVTPEMPKWGLCSMIDASPHDPARAYLALDNHENDDYTPYIYRTDDFGKSWKKLVAGIAPDTYVRVVREDPVVPGLLYAGTETGMYISFNDGANWQPLQMNLPVVPIHDLRIKDGDIAVATHGRSFWILDDITPLRQAARVNAAEPVLYEPAPAARIRFGFSPTDGSAGANPMSGAVVDYYLPADAQNVSLTIFDSDGVEVASANRVESGKGMHRTSLFPSYPGMGPVRDMRFWSGGPRSLQAPPGSYTVVLLVDDKRLTQPLQWQKDPRTPATDAELREQFRFAKEIVAKAESANESVYMIRRIRDQVNARVAEKEELKDDAEKLLAKLEVVENAIYQTKIQSSQDPLNYPIKLNNKLAALASVVAGGEFGPTKQSYTVFEMLSEQLDAEQVKLKAILDGDLAAFNQRLQSLGLEPVNPDAGDTYASNRTAAYIH